MTVRVNFESQSSMTTLHLQFGITFEDFFTPTGLEKIQHAFEVYMHKKNEGIYQDYCQAKSQGFASANQLLTWAPTLETFLGDLFDVTSAVQILQKQHSDYAVIHQIQRQFIQRRVLKQNIIPLSVGDLERLRDQLATMIDEKKSHNELSDFDLAMAIARWLKAPSDHFQSLEVAARYCAGVITLGKGHAFYQQYHHQSGLFDVPRPRDLQNLLPKTKDHHKRDRSGFSLTDQGLSAASSVTTAHYCLVCHKRHKDSCRTGLETGDGHGAHNDLGRALHGCPLEQKISEMSALKQQGLNIAALAVVMIDNPLVAVTGHRICNDCMMSCIFQSQDPVNIPGQESEILQSVLGLPWGVEMYTLLMRWNPLRLSQIHQHPSQGKRILVVGQGPAGFSLSYYLLQQGYDVMAIDGLKIEPLSQDLITNPIYSFDDISSDLENRVLEGFGGVAEYGITARWNKNYLRLIRLSLERYQHFHLKGGVRFGSTVTPDEAKTTFGCDHVALCVGAGAPQQLALPNTLSKGIRQASDFLMSLQLTGAYKKEALIGLDVHLPIVVIGGGLTAIDTATESLAYYQRQVEHFLSRLEETNLALEDLGLSPADHKRAATWMTHAKALRQERTKSNPDVQTLLQSWGGATILYRKALQSAPSYRLNHEEMIKAMEEGIAITIQFQPERFDCDHEGHVTSVTGITPKGQKTLSAQSVFIAAGTKPNTVLTKDFPQIGALDGSYFKSDQTLGSCFISTPDNQGFYSFFGDAHPQYQGSVVKAIASAKAGAREIHQHLVIQPPVPKNARHTDDIDPAFSATVASCNFVSSDIIKLVIHAPDHVRCTKPGHFFKIQPFYGTGTQQLYCDAVPLSPAHYDIKQGTLTFFIRQKGASTLVLSALKQGQDVFMMGPLGASLPLHHNKKIALIGHGVNQAALFSYGNALLSHGSHVDFISSRSSSEDYIDTGLLSASATHVYPIVSDSEETLLMHLTTFDFTSYDHIYVVAIAPVLKTIQTHLLTRALKTPATGQILAPMQCMMKEICAQCLQRHYDPKTGRETFVYSCEQQAQNLATTDITFLHNRLQQNAITESMAYAWLKNIKFQA